MKASIFQLVPVVNDELLYWHEIASFKAKGLDFGYYTFNELTPRFLSFGAHGFGSISVYALFAFFFGWNLSSIAIVNSLLLSISFLWGILYVKPSKQQLVDILLLTFTFVPISLFIVSSMTEIMNFAMVVVYFCLLSKYNSEKRKSLFYRIVIYVLLMSMVRTIYVVLFLPLCFTNLKALKLNKDFLYKTFCWVGLTGLSYLICSIFTAPYPESFLNKLFSQPNIFSASLLFVKHLLLNILRLIYPLRDNFLEITQRYLLIGLGIFYSLRLRNSNKQIDKDPVKIQILIILSMVMIILLTAYDIFAFRDYRVFAPFIFGSVFLTILNNKRTFFKSIIVYNLIQLSIIGVITIIGDRNFLNKELFIKPNNIEILSSISFSENTKDKFENTIAIDDIDKDIVLNIPPGIGISVVDEVNDCLKSKFIFTKQTKLTLKNFKIIGRCSKGTLYQKK